MENKKIKILYVVTQTFWGGVHKYIFDLATNLDNERFDITVAAGGDGSGEFWEKLAKYPHIKFKKFKYLKRSINILLDLLAVLEIFFFVRKNNFDIVHLNSSKAGVIGSIGAKLGGCKKVIYTAHGFVFNEPLYFLRKRFYIFLEKYSSFFKDKIITISKYDFKSALKYKIAKKEKMIVIYNGINEINFLIKNDVKEKINKLFFMNLNKEDRIIGGISLFYKTKGLVYLVEAASVVIKKYPNIKFLIIGDGPERKNLENEIKKYNLDDNFLLPGRIEDAYKFIKIFDIFVLPSLKEGFGYVLLEAGLAELPIIASRVGGIPEVIDDEVTGFLVEPGNSNKLAERIIYINKHPELAIKIGKNIRKKVKINFHLIKMLNETYGLY